MAEITLRVNGQNHKVAVDDPNTPRFTPCATILGCVARSSVVDSVRRLLRRDWAHTQEWRAFCFFHFVHFAAIV